MKRPMTVRLVRKELLEMRFAAGALLAVVGVLLLLRDPLSFRQDPFTMSGWALWPMAVAFLMGLGAYSRELGTGALPFLLSRPVGAGQLAAAKISAGLLVCLAVTALATLLYGLTMPAVYRPHANAEYMANGAGTMALMLGIAFLAGFAGSMLASGLGKALATAVVSIAGIAWAGDGIAHLSSGDGPAFIMGGVTVAALAAISRRALLDPRRRLIRWYGIVGASLLLAAGYAVAMRETGTAPRLPYGYEPVYSPDFARAVYAPVEGKNPTGLTDLWLSEGEVHYRRLDRGERLKVLAWTPDSRAVLYAVRTRSGATQLRTVSVQSGWSPRPVLNLPPLPFPSADLLNGLSVEEVAFSPSGRRVALHLVEILGGTGHAIVVVDTEARKSQVIRDRSGDIRLWWMDDRRLVLLRDGTPQIVGAPA